MKKPKRFVGQVGLYLRKAWVPAFCATCGKPAAAVPTAIRSAAGSPMWRQEPHFKCLLDEAYWKELALQNPFLKLIKKDYSEFSGGHFTLPFVISQRNYR